MSSTETLVVAHIGLSAGRCWFSTPKQLLYLTSLPGLVSIGASNPAVESILGGVPAPFACDLLRFGLSFSSCLGSFKSTVAGSFGPLLKPSLLHTLASRRGDVGRYKHIYLHTRALSGQHSDPCALSALEPFFGDFSAARSRFVARLAPSDSPQPRGPCPRAGPPLSLIHI